MKFRNLFLAVIAFLAPLSAQAVSITVDEIIYEGGSATDTSVLSAAVDISLSPTGLVITVTNTSSGIASAVSSHNLLTGIGFNLPDGVFIGSGSATVGAGSSSIGFTGSDVSGEWGYDTAPLDAGPFQTAPEGIAVMSVDTTITTMQASTTTKFSDTPVASPAGLAGPEFGLLSSAVDSSVAGGLAAIQDTIVFDITLDGLTEYLLANPDFDLLTYIESMAFVVSFGSPDGTTLVSEASSMILLALGLVGFAAASRKRA